MLETALLLAFTFGLLFTVASLALGATHHHVELPDASSVDHAGDLMPLNMSGLMAGSMWFGGAGYVALKFLLLPVAAVLGVGAVAGAFAYVALAKLMAFLRAGERPMRAEDYELEGTVARVSSAVPAGGVGEIVFTLNGAQRVEGCRVAGGAALEKGAEVVITGTERGLALVEPYETFMRSN